MRIALIIITAGLLAGCSTWDGFKKDFVKGVEAVEDAV